MKKFLFLLLIVFCLINSAFAKHERLYNEAEVPDFKFMHNIDPYEMEDYYNYAWSPYLLFRTASTLYFKDISIPPGYYLLAARNIKNKDYVFFKDNGKVKYVIPVMETDLVSEDFYKRKMPVPKLTKGQKIKKNIGNFFNKLFKNSKKQPPPCSFIEAKNLDGIFYSVIYYYGNKKYTMYFRTSSF